MRILPSFLPLAVAGLTMTAQLPRADAKALSLDGSGDYVIAFSTANAIDDGGRQTDTLLDAKANQSTTYTKTEADASNATQNTAIALNTAKYSTNPFSFFLKIIR